MIATRARRRQPDTPPEIAPADHRAIRRRLLRWYARAARDLPWRRTSDAYRIWISEVMLQQTRVATVVDYYARFLAAFPTIHALAEAAEDNVLALWAGLGYYRRAKHLHQAAKAVVRDLEGVLPPDAEALCMLPGIGRYTAAAIASIAHGEPVAVLDGNVKRVVARLVALRDPLESSASERTLWRLASELLDPRRPGDFNQAMMELGATVCTPRNPRCGDCPLRDHCAARRLRITADIPRVRARPVPPTELRVALAILRADGAVALTRRPPRELLGGMWKLPDAPLAPGQAALDAARGIASKLMRTPPAALRAVGVVPHAFTHRRWSVHVVSARLEDARDLRRSGVRWAPLQGVRRLALARVDEKMLSLLARHAV